MKSPQESSLFYKNVIKFIEINDYVSAISLINKNLSNLENTDDLALANLNCAFLNAKMGDYLSAIEYFSKAIFYENQLEFLNGRSKDISLNGRSDCRFKNQDYKGSIYDKRKANNIKILEADNYLKLNNIEINYKGILQGIYINLELEPKFNVLIKSSKIVKSKYDLIEDYKRVISQARIEEVIEKLKALSELKFRSGDYKGSINAIRRAEKYY